MKGGNRGSTGTGIAAFEGTPLVLGQSTPDSGVLAGLNSPAQTVLNDFTATADGLGFLCLDERGAGVPDGEEQFGIHTEAGSTVTPRHQDQAPCIESGVSITGVNSRGTPAVPLARIKPAFESTPTPMPRQRMRVNSP